MKDGRVWYVFAATKLPHTPTTAHTIQYYRYPPVCIALGTDAKAREYTRALTAVKLDKMFARPFVGALDGHGDGVFCSATSRRSLVQFLSGTTYRLYFHGIHGVVIRLSVGLRIGHPSLSNNTVHSSSSSRYM